MQRFQRVPLSLPHGTKRVADQLVATLQRAGIRRVFGLPGGAISGIFDALVSAGLDVVVCQHECMAAYLAYGHARATGRPGVVIVTSGPGVLNVLTGMAAALLDEVPMLVLVGEVHAAVSGRGALQDGGPGGLDVSAVARPLTRHVETLHHPQQAAALLARALQVADSHPRGPVLLRLPLDRTTRVQPAVAVHTPPPAPVLPDEAACADIAARLASAAQPVLFLGIGARVAGIGPLVARLAVEAACPVITDLEAKGLFPERHPLSLGLFGVGGGPRAVRYLHEADLIVSIGARLDDSTTSGFSGLLRPPGAHVVHIDHDAQRLCRAYRPDVAMACDLGAFVEALLAQLPPMSPTIRAHRTTVITAANAAEPHHPPKMTAPPHDPRAVARALQEVFGEGTVWTSDIGNHLLAAARTMRLERPDAFHVSNGLGGMGSGIGVAMGLALAYGDTRRVVGICGDGGLRMVGTELATCAKHRIPVVLAVFNDGRLGMVEHGLEALYGRAGFCDSPAVDVVGFARSLGAQAMRITSRAELAEAAHCAGKAPLVLDIPIDGTVKLANPRFSTLAEAT